MRIWGYSLTGRKDDAMSRYDLVIRGGTIVEGSQLPAYRADLAIKDGKIACISGTIRADATRE